MATFHNEDFKSLKSGYCYAYSGARTSPICLLCKCEGWLTLVLEQVMIGHPKKEIDVVCQTNKIIISTSTSGTQHILLNTAATASCITYLMILKDAKFFFEKIYILYGKQSTGHPLVSGHHCIWRPPTLKASLVRGLSLRYIHAILEADKIQFYTSKECHISIYICDNIAKLVFIVCAVGALLYTDINLYIHI